MLDSVLYIHESMPQKLQCILSKRKSVLDFVWYIQESMPDDNYMDVATFRISAQSFT